ncbi:MAG TPA: histidine kinase dimerization/phospho-acceptor domain-containing protein, partial [Pyrinomonadaceae bacterium]|nr:histidine kinase dimerization/phospho-acceptor domain-containing protein [Pyrinomonadaceae bacterium]
MSPLDPLEILQVIGYSVGALLPLWMAVQLVLHQSKLSHLERLLAALALTMGGWHTSNLVITLHGLFDLGPDTWTTLLRLADTVAVISITFAYSLLLHVHLYLWANAHGRDLNRSERLRVYMSYAPTIFLLVAVPRLWTGDYAPMFAKLSFFVIPFAFWIAYVLGLIALTELLIARGSGNRSEKRIMRTLAASFIGVGVVIFAAIGFELGQGTVVGLYLRTIANLGSLLPSALLAYYIYRYRYLEIIIEESLVVVTFATVVLTVYVFGIRTIGDWMTQRYGVRPGLVEALLILALALLAAPLRGWLAQRFHKLFEREAALYKEIVSRIGAYPGQYKDLSDLLHFVEERTTKALGLRKLKIFTIDSSDSWVTDVLELSQKNEWEPVEDNPQLLDHGFKLGYPMRREEKVEGLLAVDAASASLTTDVRSVMELLAGQVAIAIDDSRLLEENIRLERELAERERLAALGRMAATVAHEIKNPLSAIKSIAQVMREDEQLKSEYERDLQLIVGETDRLSQSVTQLLSFARKESAAEQPLTVDELLRSVVDLFKANAREQGVTLKCEIEADAKLTGKCVSAVRDAVSNLLLNALQATPSGGQVRLVANATNGELSISVEDTGAGVPVDLRERIWEPFFTTRQR